MRSWMKWLTPLMGLALVVGLQARAQADAPEGKGKITVTVLDNSGKPVAGAQVNLLARQKKEAATTRPSGDRPRPVSIAQGVTDSNGKFTFENVAPGKYGVLARVRGSGHGVSRVSVTGDGEVAVTVTLQPRGTASGKNQAQPK